MTIANFDPLLITPAFLAGALVLSTHVPLGHEVLKRGIIFIDIAIAQIAALGVIAVTTFGGELAAWQIQIFAGISAISGAALIHWLERSYASILEALIGLLFILAASGGLLLASFSANSEQLLHDLLVGQILWVSNQQLSWVAALYAPLLLIWFAIDCSKKPILFYIIFSLAITASVQLVGIYLVFASLILPALASQHIALVKNKLLVSYLVGLAGYLTGLLVSIQFDLPTGAITVWTLLVVVLIARPIIKHYFVTPVLAV
ncbi:MAG: metal ABC transporter permease [Methylococcales bacterium]